MKASDKWMMKVVAKQLQEEYKKRVEKERKENFFEKRLLGKYMREDGCGERWLMTDLGSGSGVTQSLW